MAKCMIWLLTNELDDPFLCCHINASRILHKHVAILPDTLVAIFPIKRLSISFMEQCTPLSNNSSKQCCETKDLWNWSREPCGLIACLPSNVCCKLKVLLNWCQPELHALELPCSRHNNDHGGFGKMPTCSTSRIDFRGPLSTEVVGKGYSFTG